MTIISPAASALTATSSSPGAHSPELAAANALSTAPLSARSLSVGYGQRGVIDGLDLDIAPGVITTIVGPNGCGKSTLLRTLGRLLKPTEGKIVLDGADIARLKSRELAQRLGLLPQSPTAPEGLTVCDLVSRGRHPHQSWLQQWSSDDELVVRQALARTGVSDLADRSLDSLSGGQRQRVWIAMVLAQETNLLLLDEPTTYLDLTHSLEVMDLVDELHDSGHTVVMVLHDLNLAVRYSDHLVMMKAGQIVAQGHPSEVITSQRLLDVFGLHASVIDDPVSPTPMVVPIGRRHAPLAPRV